MSQVRAQLRHALLKASLPLVASHGFSNTLLAETLRNARLDAHAVSGHRDAAGLFERGFPIALVEYIVRASNQASLQHLEQQYGTRAQMERVKCHHESFLSGALPMPSAVDIADAALAAKVRAIELYISRWHEAVALELRPSNLPFALINMAEYVDNTCYYMERSEALAKSMQLARSLLRKRYSVHAHVPPLAVPVVSTGNDKAAASPSSCRNASFDELLDDIVAGVPLSSSPRTMHGSLNLPWFGRRGKIMMQYASTITSLIGEAPPPHPKHAGALLKV